MRMLAREAQLTVLLAMLWTVPAAHGREGTGAPHRLRLGGRSRSYWVHVPPGDNSQRSVPLVVVLHGHGGDARQAMRVSGMSALADQEGFLVAYPNGTGWLNLHRSWNAGACCGYAMGKGVDDVAFIRALIEEVARRYLVDRRRVYVTGISNGAMMAYRLACELSEEIAAIAPVAGALSVDRCTPVHPVSVISFRGTADRYVPYDDEAAAFWVRHNRCEPMPARQTHGPIVLERYHGGTDGSEVMRYTIDGGGHAWPGGQRGWRFGAAPTPELSATEVMWEFFTRHPKP